MALLFEIHFRNLAPESFRFLTNMPLIHENTLETFDSLQCRP
jgi:hypothetical protein